MFNNMYSNYNAQANIDKINNQIMELERLKQQIPQQVPQGTNLTQNFQLAPGTQGLKYANSYEDVKQELTLIDTPYFSHDMSILWLKKQNGEIKIYELSEIIPKDEKDIKIEFLMAQIEEMKKEMKNNDTYANNNGAITKSTESKESTSISTISKSKAKPKQSTRDFE